MSLILVQKQHLGPLGTGVIFALILGVLGLILASDQEPAVRMGLFLLSAFLFTLWLVFHRLTVIVTDRELRAGFALFKSRVPVGEILAVEEQPVPSLWRTGGLGLRITFDGHLAYFPRRSPVVRVERRRGLPLLIGSDRPDELVAALSGVAPALEETVTP